MIEELQSKLHLQIGAKKGSFQQKLIDFHVQAKTSFRKRKIMPTMKTATSSHIYFFSMLWTHIGPKHLSLLTITLMFPSLSQKTSEKAKIHFLFYLFRLKDQILMKRNFTINRMTHP